MSPLLVLMKNCFLILAPTTVVMLWAGLLIRDQLEPLAGHEIAVCVALVPPIYVIGKVMESMRESYEQAKKDDQKDQIKDTR